MLLMKQLIAGISILQGSLISFGYHSIMACSESDAKQALCFCERRLLVRLP